MKTVTPTPAAAPQFEFKGKKVFVLVPNDEKLARTTTERLDEPFSTVEVLPIVTQSLKVGLLNDNNVVIVAHCVKVRERQANGRFAMVDKLTISEPIFCEKYAQPTLEDGMVSMNIPALADAIQKATGTPDLVARLSSDKENLKKTLKLFTT